MSSISINTSQNVRLEYEIASVGERILATLLDYLIFIGWMILISILSDLLAGEFGTITFVVMILPVFLYHLVCEVFFNGQSVGKKTLNIRVLKTGGTQPSIGDYLLRWIFRLIDCSIGMGSVALLCILINGKGQRLGDIAAGTTVVRIRRAVNLGQIEVPDAPPDYSVTYPEAMTLSDKDISVIRRILRKSVRTGNREMLRPLAEKVSGITGLEAGEDHYLFLATILNDYHYLAGKSAVTL